MILKIIVFVLLNLGHSGKSSYFRSLTLSCLEISVPISPVLTIPFEIIYDLSLNSLNI